MIYKRVNKKCKCYRYLIKLVYLLISQAVVGYLHGHKETIILMY